MSFYLFLKGGCKFSFKKTQVQWDEVNVVEKEIPMPACNKIAKLK